MKITDAGELSRSGMGLADRLSLWLMAHWPSFLGRVLAPDGRGLTVRGGMTGTGTMDEAGTRASYELHWLGIAVRQSTQREPDLITVRQDEPGFSAAQTLVRQRA